LPTPILFAHRGGAKEAPESTEAGFRHAMDCRTDVLELDLQLTRDEEMVVWHGPSLANVRLEIEETANKPRTRFNIGDYMWSELKNKAWVLHPESNETIDSVPKDPSRRLLTLEEFLGAFATSKLNIELKEPFTPVHLDRLINILNRHSPDRVRVVASNRNEKLLQAFRDKAGERFATNLAFSSLLRCRIAAMFGTLRKKKLWNRALELPHASLLAPRTLIEQVGEAGGGCYIFLTHIPFVKALDDVKGSPTPEAVFEILDRGVDGIMTDRPGRVRQLMDEWIAGHPMS
jgi:glycerophosphoryl diester phosphodiesterase